MNAFITGVCTAVVILTVAYAHDSIIDNNNAQSRAIGIALRLECSAPNV